MTDEDEVALAFARIGDYLQPTPCREALGLEPGGSLWLKLENMQPTGAFKVRGAFHKLLALRAEPECHSGRVIAASTGNHGAAVAFAARTLGVQAEVVLPELTSAARQRAVERFGAHVIRHGQDCGEAEVFARQRAGQSGDAFISPYNDLDVALGQGTLGGELLEQIPNLARVYVAVGGGGLIGGVGAAIKQRAPHVEIIGCSPHASFVMEASVRAGVIVQQQERPTLSVATAGSLEPGSVTLELCTAHVDRWLRVTEDQIRDALRELYRAERVLGEGAAGVALAAWRIDTVAGRHANGQGGAGTDCVVICGGNLDEEHLVPLFAPTRSE